jgi:diaminopimelate epimerase
MPACSEFEGTVVYKMTGSGNDFVVVDGRVDPVDSWTPEAIRCLCARGTGVGADGFVVLEPGSGPGAVRFHFFNADGGRSAMCGNAALCSVRLSAYLELAPPDRIVLETDVGIQQGRCIDAQPERAEVELPSSTSLSTPDIPLEPGERTMRLTRVGVPHLVVLVDSVGDVGVSERGRALREHPGVGSDGANVNFVGNGGASWAMRTYERGVEAETLACGTGAVASAATLAAVSQAHLPIDIRCSSGAILTVSAAPAPDGSLPKPRLTGQARLVFRAVLGGASHCTHLPPVDNQSRPHL